MRHDDESLNVDDVMARGERSHKFTNWASTFSCTPALYFEPKSVAEIQEILQTAGKLRKRVRVVGSGFSPSDIACTEGFMVCLKNHKAVLEINHEKHQVTVQAGMTLEELNELLDSHGLAFSNLGAVSGQSSAGCISTCTHGSGKNFGLLGTHVISLELITASGEVIYCSRSQNHEIFQSALCGLGAVGIIVTVTWQCEPAFRLQQRCVAMTLDEVLENLETHLSSSEHFKFHWFPHTGCVKTFHVSRTTKPLKDNSSWFWDYAVGYYSLEFAYWLSSFVPSFVPYINLMFFKLLHSQPVERVDQSYKVFNFNCLFKQYVTEWAIPREKTAYVLRKLQGWLKESAVSAHIPVEVRFVKKDDIYLSPCCDQDMCFINIISYRPYNKFIPFESYWKFYEDLMLSVGGKPHWAKAHQVTYSQFEKMYPKFNRFRQVCQKLDPAGMFRNKYTERSIFGPSKQGGV